MVNQTRVCILMPPRIQSVGLGSELFGNETATYNWYDYSLPRFELHIALIFVVAQIFHFFLKRLGVPLFTSQLIAGLTLSQAVLQDKSSTVWTDKGVQVLGTVGAFGYSFFMFLIGVKMDPSLITRANKSTLTIGILSVIAPLLCAVPVILLSFDPISERGPKFQTFFLSACYAVTSFPAIFVLLGELKILNSELGRIALSSAITSDLLSLFMLIVGNVLNVWMQDGGTAALNELALVVAFLAVVFLVLRPGILMAIRYTPEGKAVTETCIFVVFLLFLACVPLIQWSNVMPLAPYILGLAVPHGPPLGSALVEKFESMVNNLFLPLFVVSFGLRMKPLDIDWGDSDTLLKANVALVVVALVVKLIACFLPSYLSRMPTMDALALAFIMSTKGIIDMGMFTFFFDEAIIDQKMFGFTFYVVLYMATIVPVVVKYLYDPTRRYAGYNKRSLMHWKPYSELPIVSVIHVPDNVASVINLLEASCPTKENPMDVNVLHLIKLSGQANPIFISHQRKRRTSSVTASYSQNVIVSFNKFEGNNWGAVSVNAFTAVSPPDLMHDDICNLALDRLACLIILPFHRRWYIDGSIESDNDYIRALNARVLEKAPCSVGIFIDRDNLQRRAPMPVDSSLEAPSYKVAIIFLGGSDDREALTLSKRMSRDNRVALTVVRLTAQNSNEEWDSMLESEMLREMKSNGYINYMEKGVADGPETAMIVRSMVAEFDLIIVGRRYNLESPQTSGLKEWSEFPELGVLGDLLASVDNHSGRCSVLIVQQEEIVISSKPKMDMFP
ncbi:hypothetical protein ACOSQ2_020726 [Xanthoceras sorbifolium]|uniref:Cation/H+ exchanger domain-containing protein n=1 Tax=Xanthoceras sorbifolium TaxID=99658 RepID=A0ABQ8HLQ9_9ROSI|nr:hypothetical protein JRO89_XS09G0181900 [Xanthoceras sorbifolium]